MEPNPLDAVAYINIYMYADGALKVSGNIGDAPLAMKMLDAARDAVKNQIPKTIQANKLIVPADYVGAYPSDAHPLVPYGDVSPELIPHPKE
jgi:hypothetical protein